MLKKILLFTILSSTLLRAGDLKISGQTEYTQQKDKTLITSLNAEYRINLYEPEHKMWVIYLSGNVNPDYDQFGKIFKIATFTSIGMDF